MSVRSRTIRLALDAAADYDDILLYGTKTWGEEQADRYQAKIDHTIESLREFPELGRQRDDLCDRCRYLTVERHIVYYRIEQHTIEIVRILHERVDPTRHLSR